MKHPSDAELALYAGGDLGWVRQRLTERHVRNCGPCQDVAADFSELRSEGSSFPNIQWNKLAADMQANIRLGLAAGECVNLRPARSFVSGQRLAIAGGMLGVLLVAGIWIERPVARPLLSRVATIGTVLEEAESGIQVREGRQTLRILNSSNRNVSYSVGGRGELRARSLDPETGNVTINHVYGE
jgi:hypothetical protein